MLFGSYEVLLCVARGGMASVWAAQQRGVRGESRLVALKTVLPELAEPEFESMFLNEAHLAGRIHHPNVCEVFELVEHDGVRALSMEWVDGDTLAALLGSTALRAIDMRAAAHIVSQVACGLHAAHELSDEHGAPMQIVHRDVSPQNVLISRTGQVKVADFGVAKAHGSSYEETAIGRVKGKVGYMSPEQAEGKPLDRRSDVFALGVVLYVATVGVHPFRSSQTDERDAQLLRLLVGRFDAPSAVVPGFPPELEAIILRAMQREPEERFATADEMRRKLCEWLARTGPLALEQLVARIVAERAGSLIEGRAARIQRCVLASQQLRHLGSVPGGADLTFLPMTSGPETTFHTLQALTGSRSRQAARSILTALTAAALGVVGTLAVAGSSPEQPVLAESLAPSTAPLRWAEGVPVDDAAVAHEDEPRSKASGALSKPDTALERSVRGALLGQHEPPAQPAALRRTLTPEERALFNPRTRRQQAEKSSPRSASSRTLGAPHRSGSRGHEL